MVLALVSRFKNYSLSLFLLPVLHIVLLELFASSLYILYFLTLLFALYFLNLRNLFLSNKIFLFSIIYWLGLYILHWLFEDTLYDIYIDLDLRFTMSYISNEVSSILTLLHLFILFLLGYNRDKLF